MPSRPIYSVENNFTKGLITESTGLNFPENASTDTSNCEYTLVGEVLRRMGINKEVNGADRTIATTGFAQNTYMWNNPGGDGNSKILCQQIGNTVYFIDVATSTVANPLSVNIISGIDVSLFTAAGATFDPTVECQFADGNGYLFIYQSTIETQYITYNPITKALAALPISIQTRDFSGILDGLPVNTRPATLSRNHQYNLQNQGWTSGNAWAATATNNISITNGQVGFTVASGITGITNGAIVTISGPANFGGNTITASGTVTSYSGNTLVINVTSSNSSSTGQAWTITPLGVGYLSAWFAVEGNYPSNADVWWYFKNPNGVFDPTDYAGNVTLATGNAPQGHYILNEFNQNRAAISGLAGINTVSTTKRPTTGAWFQGRVWYTGVDSSQVASTDTNFYTWTENIYFSQIVTGVSDFGLCYQTDDPTSENLNALLPTDGGVITIVGCGTIHKLWPTANGMLVFANNGVWFITGSLGIGFSASDYTITHISSVKVLSAKSFVDVMGLPYFWNEEGIYQVESGQSGQLAVNPITVGTILDFYNNIPLASKKYAHAAYDPIDYRIQWVYKNTAETSVTTRYQFNSILNYNTYNKAFYPYSISGDGVHFISGITYVSYPYVSTAKPLPGFKYSASAGTTFTFADEHDTNFVDWGTVNFVSYFITGYKLHGKAMQKTQLPYVYVFNGLTDFNPVSYYLQSIWDFSSKGNESKFSVKQFTEVWDTNKTVFRKAHRLRGMGYAVQFKFSSVDGKPFHIIGWAVYENVNASI